MSEISWMYFKNPLPKLPQAEFSPSCSDFAMIVQILQTSVKLLL
jgi:hypothetical protein